MVSRDLSRQGALLARAIEILPVPVLHKDGSFAVVLAHRLGAVESRKLRAAPRWSTSLPFSTTEAVTCLSTFEWNSHFFVAVLPPVVQDPYFGVLKLHSTRGDVNVR